MILQLLLWWLVLTILGILALPLTFVLLRSLPDRGLGFARQVGLLLSAYLLWMLVSLGILQNTAANAAIAVLSVGGVSAYLLVRNRRQFMAELCERKRNLIATEALFMVAMLGFALFRAYNPDIAATEKPMEFAFINGILRSRTFPPIDPWLSGYGISYYYFGYVMTAMLTRLSGLTSEVTFNLMGVSLFALVVSGSYSIVYNLVQAYLMRESDGLGRANSPWSATACVTGFLGSVLVALMGNLEGLFELIRAHGLGSAKLWEWLDIKNLPATVRTSKWYPDDTWWWWRASRVIHDRDALGNSVEVIDEFPFFSFLLGDNHPHVLALPFVLLAVALALNVLLSRAQPRTWNDQAEESESRDSVLTALRRLFASLWPGSALDWVMWALFLGGIGFLNTWDYPIYLGIFVISYAVRHRLDTESLSSWLSDVPLVALTLLVAGIVLYFPFYFGFRSQAGGIGWVGEFKTRIHQYLLMNGVFVFLGGSLLVGVALRFTKPLEERMRLPAFAQIVGGVLTALFLVSLVRGWWTGALVVGLVAVGSTLWIWASQGRRDESGPYWPVEPSTSFALLLMVAGFALTAFVEWAYLKDTFDTRMNTVFKFYYQAWVLLGLSSAYAAFYIVHRLRKRAVASSSLTLAVWGSVAALLVAAGLSYTVAAIPSKAGGFSRAPTLNGVRYIQEYRREEYEAIQWLKANAPADATMLEASGGSYSEFNWSSAHSGVPTLLGWGGHELQWRGSYDEPGRREPDIAAVYQGVDPRSTLDLLDRHGIDYVFVGPLERRKYGLNPTMLSKFDGVLRRVYETDGVVIYAR